MFLLCTPSTHPDDISVTIRSRCRVVPLRQPPADGGRRGAGPPGRHRARRGRLGGGGRAGARRAGPAGWPATRRPAQRREAVLAVPRRLTGIGAVLRRRVRADRGGRGGGRRVGRRDRRDRAGRAGDRARRGRHRPGRGRRAAGRRRAAQGPGEAAEVAGHPGPAGRAGPGAGRPGRLLPGRADHGAAARRSRRCTPTPPRWPAPARRSGTPRARCAGWRRCSRAGTAIEANVKPRIAVEAMMLALWRG